MRVLSRLRNSFKPIRQVADNIWVLSPIAIPVKQHWSLVKFINQGFLAYRVARFLKKVKVDKPLLWTYHPFVRQLIKRIEYTSLVYHCVDDLSTIPGIEAQAFNQAEQSLLGLADVVFVTSKNLLNKCLPYNKNTHYFSNVVDIAHFQQAYRISKTPVELESIQQPRLVYHGVLSDFKLDFSLILKVAQRKKNWQFVFIGEEREGQFDPIVADLDNLENVHFLGYKPYVDLPHYLAHMSLGLLPSLVNEYTKSMFPMKYYEYLASGLRVVSTPIDFAQYTDNALMVGETVDAFIHAIEAQLDLGKLTLEASTEAVAQNTWSARLDKMLAIVEA